VDLERGILPSQRPLHLRHWNILRLLSDFNPYKKSGLVQLNSRVGTQQVSPGCFRFDQTF
jgi:hypothetical protein